MPGAPWPTSSVLQHQEIPAVDCVPPSTNGYDCSGLVSAATRPLARPARYRRLCRPQRRRRSRRGHGSRGCGGRVQRTRVRGRAHQVADGADECPARWTWSASGSRRTSRSAARSAPTTRGSRHVQRMPVHFSGAVPRPSCSPPRPTDDNAHRKGARLANRQIPAPSHCGESIELLRRDIVRLGQAFVRLPDGSPFDPASAPTLSGPGATKRVSPVIGLPFMS